MSSMPRQVTIASEPIEYHVRRSGEATEPRIDIGIHEITVVLPEDSSVDPEELVHENGQWVLKKKQKYDQYRKQAPDREFVEGEEFPYLGEAYEVAVDSVTRVDEADGILALAKNRVEKRSIREVLKYLYRCEARSHLTSRLDHYAREMDVEYGQLELRNQRTRWGSCSSSGTVSLNWRLMMAPPEIVDYVVIHELAHLTEPSHNNAFWHLVSTYDSDYEEHAEWLDQNSTALIFDRDDL